MQPTWLWRNPQKSLSDGHLYWLVYDDFAKLPTSFPKEGHDEVCSTGYEPENKAKTSLKYMVRKTE